MTHGNHALSWELIKMGGLVSQVTERLSVKDDSEYAMAGVRWYAGGVFHRETVLGKNMSAKKVTPLVLGALIYNRLFAWKESFGVVGKNHAGLNVSNEFPQFLADESKILPEFLYLFCTIPTTTALVNAASAGSAAVSRNRFKESEFLNFEMRLPPLETQQAIVSHWRKARDEAGKLLSDAEKEEIQVGESFLKELGLPATRPGPLPRVFSAKWSDIPVWSCRAVHLSIGQGDLKSGNFPIVKGLECLESVQHGCSMGPSSTPTSLKVLKISAATKGFLDKNQSKFISDTKGVRKAYQLRSGDVLACRTNGTLNYVGMSALVEEDERDMIFPDKLIRLRAKSCLSPNFLWLILQTPPLRNQIEAAARTAVGNYAIGGRDFWNFDYPLPPLPIQQKLVTKITAAHKSIAEKRAAAAALTTRTAREVEEMILGHRRVE